VQESEEGWYDGRLGDQFGVLPVTYVEAVKAVPMKARAEVLYDFSVRRGGGVAVCMCVRCVAVAVCVCSRRS